MRFLPGHNGLVNLKNVQISLPEEITENKIRELRSMPDEEAAQILDQRIRFLENQYKHTFVERGFILLEMEERGLWTKLIDPNTQQPYVSMERWIVTAATHSRSDCFASLKAVRELRDVPKEQLLEIPRCNIHVLQNLSTQVRMQPEIIRAAREMTVKEFTATIGQFYPEQHMEQKQQIVVKPTVSQRVALETACDAVKVLYDVEDREGQLEVLASFFMDGQCEFEEHKGRTNRQAYNVRMGR